MISKTDDRPPDETIRSLSRLMQDTANALPDGTITLDTVLEAFHERGFGLLLLFFSAPMALPVPVPPGINILLASPLVLLTAQQALGRHTLWMPASVRKKTFSGKKIRGIFKAVTPWLEKIELLVRPRLGWLTWDGPSRVMGVLGLIMALTVMIPVPMTNTIPSLGIALMAIGITMRDGLAVLAGAIIGIGWVSILAAAVIFLGSDALDILKETIKSFLT